MGRSCGCCFAGMAPLAYPLWSGCPRLHIYCIVDCNGLLLANGNDQAIKPFNISLADVWGESIFVNLVISADALVGGGVFPVSGDVDIRELAREAEPPDGLVDIGAGECPGGHFVSSNVRSKFDSNESLDGG